MTMHRVTIMRIAAGAILGAILGACLPSMPEGERGEQCWLDHTSDQSRCASELYRCVDRIGTPGNDGDAFDQCDIELERCASDATWELEQCDWRGCFPELIACVEACSESDLFGCVDECERELERCAPWYDADCEQKCQEDSAECFSFAPTTTSRIDCEDARVRCVRACY